MCSRLRINPTMKLRNRDTNTVGMPNGRTGVEGVHYESALCNNASNTIDENEIMRRTNTRFEQGAKQDREIKSHKAVLISSPVKHGSSVGVLPSLTSICEQINEGGVDVPPTTDPVTEPVDVYPPYDYDAAHLHDPNAVTYYAVDIFAYEAWRENDFRTDNYMRWQAHLRPKSRAILVNWIVDLQQNLELLHETLYRAVKIMDLFLDREPGVLTQDLQLLAATAVFIASKFEERWPPLIDDLTYVSDGAVTRDGVMQMELRVLRAIRFDVGCPLSYSFLRRFAKVCNFDMRVLTLARYILETSLMFYEFSGVSGRLMAVASLLLAIRMAHVGDWNAVLAQHSGFKLEQVESLMWSLNHMMIRCNTMYVTLTSVHNKYSTEAFFHSTDVSPLDDAYPDDEPVRPPSHLRLEQ